LPAGAYPDKELPVPNSLAPVPVDRAPVVLLSPQLMVVLMAAVFLVSAIRFLYLLVWIAE
jgi:hypothetical protein